MSTVSIIEIEINNMKSNHMLYANEGSNCLVVVFPGGNNSCDRPILNSLREYFINNKCDVLCISYENIVNKEDPYNRKLNSLIFGIHSALIEIEKKNKYSDKIFISRSFGNIVSSELKVRNSLNIEKNIYISPTSPAIKYLSDCPGFIITASNDEYLSPDEIKELSRLGNDKILIFRDGNHGLETENTTETSEFHKSAVAKIIEFLEK